MTIVMVILLGLGITACGKYYMVKDPGTGNIYYTDKIDKEKSDAVKFKDANTGSDVTIQNPRSMKSLDIRKIPRRSKRCSLGVGPYTGFHRTGGQS
jgi:hypothetical protein